MAFFKTNFKNKLSWAFGGAIGKILGFKQSKKPKSNMPKERLTCTSSDFSASLLVLAASIMKADGRVMKAELNYVKRFFVKAFGVDYTKTQMLLFRNIMKRDIPVEVVCKQVAENMDYPAKLQLLDLLFSIAEADKLLHQKEKSILHHISVLMGIYTFDFESIRAMNIELKNSSYTILGLEVTASNEEIKSAFRRAVRKYHPDKVTHLGENYLKQAREKFQKVTDAYIRLKETRGIA